MATKGVLGPPARVPNEIRRGRTRTAILDAAEAQIVQRGFASTTIDALAPDAGVSKGAVYFHFGSKDELLEALLIRSQQTVFEPALVILKDDESERSVVTRIIKFFNQVGALDNLGRYLLPVIVSIQGAAISDAARARIETVSASVRTELTRAIDEGEAAGEIPSSLRPTELAAITMAMMDGMLLQWHRYGQQINGPEFLRAGRHALLGALGAYRR